LSFERKVAKAAKTQKGKEECRDFTIPAFLRLCVSASLRLMTISRSLRKTSSRHARGGLPLLILW